MKSLVGQAIKLGVGIVLLVACAISLPAQAYQVARDDGTAPTPTPSPKQQHHLLLQNRSNGRAQAPDVPQRDGHLSAADRKLLRQHIEDAARDMYKH